MEPHPAVLIVGPLPPPAGGMANQTAQLQRLLASHGLRVETVNTQAPYRPAWVARLRGIRALFRLVPYLARLWRACGRVQVVHAADHQAAPDRRIAEQHAACEMRTRRMAGEIDALGIAAEASGVAHRPVDRLAALRDHLR